MHRGALLALVGLTVLMFVAVPCAREFIRVDVCLDGGGSYNYIDAACDHSANHQYSSYTQRHPLAPPVALLGLGLMVAGILIARRPKRKAN